MRCVRPRQIQECDRILCAFDTFKAVIGPAECTGCAHGKHIQALGASADICSAKCGDGLVASEEESCDDNNTASGDGCNSTCGVDCGYSCSAGDASNCTVTSCGDGKRAGSELCDDNNTASGDGCSAICTVEGLRLLSTLVTQAAETARSLATRHVTTETLMVGMDAVRAAL
jgi:cysteine-rich repeat protein